MSMRPSRLALLFLATALTPVRAQQAVPPPVAPAAVPAPRVAPPAPGQLEAPPAAPLPAVNTELPPRPSLPGEVPRVPIARPRAGSSTSTSGQFIVHGDDLALRSAFSSKCEDIATEVRKLLRDTTPWGIPIVVLLNSGESALKAGKSVDTTISQIEFGGFHLQVTIHLRPDLRQADARREIVRALLAERILRDQKQIMAQRPLLLPDWLFTGILEALEFRSRTRPSTLFAAIFKSGRIYGIEEIIEASPVAMDALSRTIYQTSCCALVLALLDQPDGGLRMAKFLTALAADPRTERELLDQHFPAIAGSPSSLNKWWSLQLAALASPTLSEPLSIADTLEQLDHALTFHYRAKASEVPRPRPVVARVESPPTPKPAAPAKADKPENDKAETAAAEVETDAKPKRSFLSRLNPFSRAPKEEDPDAVIAAALEEASMEGLVEEPAEAVKGETAKNETAKTAAPAAGTKAADKKDVEPPAEQAATEPAAQPFDKPSFLRRLFGRDDDPAKVEEPEAPQVEPSDTPKVKQPEAPKVEQEAALKPAPATAIKNEPLPPSPVVAKPKAPEAVVEDDAPVTIIINEPMPPTAKAKPEAKPAAPPEAKPETPAAEPAPKVEPAEKPSLLNPLNWFRRAETLELEAPAQPESPAGKTGESTEPAAAKDETVEPAKPATARAPLPRTAAWLASVGATSGQPVLAMDFLGLRLGRKKPEPTEETPIEPTTEAKKDAKTEAKPEVVKTETEKAGVKEAGVKEAEVKEAEVKEGAVKEGEAKMEAPETDEADAPRKPSLFRRLLWGDSTKPKPDEAPMPEEAKAADAKPEAAKADAAQPADPKPAVAKPTPPKPTAPAAPADDSLVAAEVALEDYAVVLRRSDAKTILEGNIRELAALQNRAAVLFRPIVTDASQLLGDLREGRTKGADTRIRELRRRIREAETRSKAVRDLLDLHEANETLFMSGVFEDYLKLPETLQKELPERTDPIARYLDALEREFARE